MFRTLLLIGFILLAIVPAEAAEPLPTLVKRVKPSVVTVVTYDRDGEQSGQGTGFVVAPGQLLTNVHVLKGATRAVVRTSTGGEYPVDGFLAADPAADLALFYVAGMTAPTLPLAATAVSEGTAIVVVGSPLGLELTVSTGIVSAVRTIDGVGDVLQITAPISPGSSGSPVLSANGTVVGIATLQFRTGQNLNFAVGSLRARKLAPGALQPLRKLGVSEGEMLVGEGFALQQEGEIDAALRKYRTAMRLDPAYPRGWFMAGLAELQSGQAQAALELYQQAVTLHAENGEIQFGYGLALEAADGCTAALPKYERAVALNSDLALAHVQRGRCLEAVDRTSDALDAFLAAVKADPGEEAAFMHLGRLLHAEYDENAKAEQALRKAIELKPDYALAHYNLGVVLSAQGQQRDAAKSYWAAIEANENLVEAHYNLGIILQTNEQYAAAKIALGKAVALNPAFADGQLNLGFTLENLGEYAAAADAYVAYAKLTPESALGPYSAARMWAKSEEFADAKAGYREAIRRDAKYEDAYLDLGILQVNRSEYAAALETFHALLAVNPGSAKGHNNLCLVYNQLEETRQAVEACLRAAELNPDLPQPYFNLAWSALKLERYDLAEDGFRKAMALDPEWNEARYWLGATFLYQERWRDAALVYREIIRRAPDWPLGHFGLGMTYVGAGERGQALEEYKILKGLDAGLAEKLFEKLY